MIGREPLITVGVMDGLSEVHGRLEGTFTADFGPVSGTFSARVSNGVVVLTDHAGREIARSTALRLEASRDALFALSNVVIGKEFHWQRSEEQQFRGNLLLAARPEGALAAINEVPLETYLESVVSSEMSAAAPPEFLKAHAILARSWLLAALERKGKPRERRRPRPLLEKEGEVIRWYDREQHDLYDVCADDHCQRYQGLTKITSHEAGDAVKETRGMALTYRGRICDARYAKACGGRTERFDTAWEDKRIPYLVSIPDARLPYRPIATEAQARDWILSAPEAYCHTTDRQLLEKILPDFDLETEGFFRWIVTYGREELEEILREKAGWDFGLLQEIVPLDRGPSGRISRLKIVGSKLSMIVGKELEIRRWLSRSHLYSSAFIVEAEPGRSGKVKRFVFKGAGWGHGVGLCQIGAAVMASRGSTAEEILKHYFQGARIEQVYG